jgi:putative transposase
MRVNKFTEGYFYHVYNRGNSKQKIFHNKDDYDRFIKLLYLSNTKNRFKFRDDVERKGIDAFDYERNETLVEICFYVLMPNHFHLCLFIRTKGVGAEKYMQKLEGGYARYYNQKYKRTGTLFEGNFKNEIINDERYLKYLFSYIHLNPIKLIQTDWKEKGIKDMVKVNSYLEDYEYSSYKDFCNNIFRKSSKLLNTKEFLNTFEKEINLKKEIFNWLNYKL